MGNGYNHHFRYRQQNLDLHKTTFLPMLCSKTSIKDVRLPGLEDRSAPFSDDPLSPKISCMGQVKRNNKIIGFPTAAASASASHHSKLSLSTAKNSNDVKYFKLKRLFSGRNLGGGSTSCAVNSCRRREVMGNNGVSKATNKADESREREEISINIAEMDPPLPVIKRVPKPSDEGDHGNSNNLWKRRSRGDGLRTLELQQIKIPRHHQVEITTV